MTSQTARNAGKMGIATLLSRFMGLLREQVFAFLFGASDAADAFNIAFRIPNLLRDLFAEGAMSAAFVPTFTKALTQSKNEAMKILIGVISFLAITLSILTAFGMIFSQELVRLYASSYALVPGKIELTTKLTQIMFPFFPMVAIAAVCMGALNALGSFFLPAFAPVLFNIASVLCGIFLTPLIQKYTQFPPIYSMGVAVLIGGFLQFYLQWWKLKSYGISVRKNLKEGFSSLQNPGVREVLILFIPGTIGLAATQISILINSIYATSQGSGAVSWLNYAFRLMQFQIGIFGVSLAAATLPQVSRALALGRKDSAAQELEQSIRLNYAINAPAAMGFMILSVPILALIFEHGRFGHSDTIATSQALFWYSIGLPAYSMVKVLVPVFYALKKTKIPVILSFVSVAVNLVLNSIFLTLLKLPFWSLALSTSITAVLNAIVLGYFAQKHLPGSIQVKTLFGFLKHTFVTIIMGFAAFFMVRFSDGFAGKWEILMGPGHLIKITYWAIQVGVIMFIAISIWLCLCQLLKLKESELVLNVLRKKIKK